MANTLLNTERTVAATSNPTANIQKVSNKPAEQIGEPLQVPTPQTNTNAVNPITIPIQIQPQIATAPQITANNDMQNLQTYNTNQNAAPNPVKYTGTKNTATNTIDFDQIYSSYQSQYGTNNYNNKTTSASGIKRTSIGTTIVTPTTKNTNSVQGQYQSEYSATINSLISTLLTETESLNSGDFYDPAKDTSLRLASEYAANSVVSEMVNRGILNSSSTTERIARVVGELIPQYEKLAYDRKVTYLNQLANTAQLVMNYDSQQFEYWKDAKDREFQEKEFAYKKKQDSIDNAWKRVDELGYVDNKASKVLGVKVGTLSGAARLAKEQQEFELRKMREQAKLEYENTKALYKVKSELETQQAKTLANYENKYNSNSSSNYKDYDEIIKNSYAEYDKYTQQWIVSSEDKYNQLANYLDNLYASGAITATEHAKLSAKYSNYIGKDSESQTTSNQQNTTQTNNTETNKTEGNKRNAWLNGALKSSLAAIKLLI